MSTRVRLPCAGRSGIDKMLSLAEGKESIEVGPLERKGKGNKYAKLLSHVIKYAACKDRNPIIFWFPPDDTYLAMRAYT